MGYSTVQHFIALLLLSVLNLAVAVSSNLDTYIVHVELPPTSLAVAENLQDWYKTFLPPSSSSSQEIDHPQIIHSYRNVFKGFAARLTPEQVKAMEKIPGFISARPEKFLTLDTTHSPNFLGLNQNVGVWRDSNYGRGVIIGVIDGGVIPDHLSFNDDGMPPPPAKWKGVCQFNSTTMCNNKLIGARHYNIGNGTPLDEDGHGMHTSTTAAGNFVSGANVFGNANGTAAGIAPLAHIASYKACVQLYCPLTDTLMAIDHAIDDGVDVLSLSLSIPPGEFFNDDIAVGTFTATQRGIFVSTSAGNRGPYSGTVRNGAPWILTVGASSIDRKIRATAVLGNGEALVGESTFQPADFPSDQLPLVYPGAILGDNNATFCLPEALRKLDLGGSIVMCMTATGWGIGQGQNVREAGGAAMILFNREIEGYTTHADSHVIPAVHISYVDGLKVAAYANSTISPTATVAFQGTIIGDSRAPELAAFSSRGPNLPSPGILKPDIIGPGHNILAGWHVSVENNTKTKSNFNIISGTSMSCPHLSGAAALIKSVHPNWSPAAIKSALMTTADQVNLAGDQILDETRKPANLYGVGSGHVNVVRATNPGLVYDIHSDDYLPYLCGLSYTDQEVGHIVDHPVRCSEIGSIPEAELNYPSFSVVLPKNRSLTCTRTVTNVGVANSTYSVATSGLRGVDLRVEPTSLQFSQLNQKLTFQVTFSRMASATRNTTVEGSLTLGFSNYRVRSPILVSLL